MRFFPVQKIGQSGYELVLSVFLSFFLHAAFVILALIFYTAVAPKVYLPPFYEVKLVGQPAEIAPTPAPSPPPPQTRAEPAPAEKKPPSRVKTAPPKPLIKASKKDAIPGLAPQKPKPTRIEEAEPQAKPAAEQARPALKELASVPSVSAAASAKVGSKTERISVKTLTEDFRVPGYSDKITAKISNNWNPPPGAKGISARVQFAVLRSGRLRDVKLLESSGNVYYDQAVERAIRESSPFPPMPEEYFKDFAVFSVDLVPEE